jgi:hypothetical protein
MRLPRKLKKKVKKIVERKTAVKCVMAAMATAQSLAQMAIISATPGFLPHSIALKALKTAEIVQDSAKAIQNILSEPPNSWRDFLKQ